MDANERKAYFANARDVMEDGKVREGGKFDEAVLLIATGTLGLSINFVLTWSGMGLIWKPILIVGWSCLLLLTLLQVFGYFFAVLFHAHMANALDVATTERVPTEAEVKDYNRWKSKGVVIQVINISNMSLLFVGLLLLMVFTSANLLAPTQEDVATQEAQF